jgi:hypothetical protein
MLSQLMNPHVTVLANTFYTVAAVLGIPSLSVTLLYVCYRVQLWITPSPSSFARVKNPDGVLLILEGMTRTVGTLASVLGFLGKFVFGGLAIVSIVILILAMTLFFIGRGLHAHQGWARVVASLLMIVSLLTSCLCVTSIRGPWLVLSFSIAATSVYALWILWHDFAV